MPKGTPYTSLRVETNRHGEKNGLTVQMKNDACIKCPINAVLSLMPDGNVMIPSDEAVRSIPERN